MTAFGKYSAVVLLVMILTAKMLSSYFVLIDYRVNKDFISKYLCENRYTPSLACEGKCLLMKKLQKSAETPESGKEQQAAKILTQEFAEEVFSFNCTNTYTVTAIEHFARYKDEAIGNFPQGFFRPPIG